MNTVPDSSTIGNSHIQYCTLANPTLVQIEFEVGKSSPETGPFSAARKWAVENRQQQINCTRVCVRAKTNNICLGKGVVGQTGTEESGRVAVFFRFFFFFFSVPPSD